jgi:hypothetical protein
MRTVGKVLEEVLPNGTRPESQWKALFAAENRDPSLDPLAKMRFPPLLPTDLFAAVGHLARISGIVPFFEPSAFATNLPPRRFIFDKNTRAELDDAGVAWRDDNRGGRPPPLVDDLWSNLLDHWDEPLNPPPVVGTDSVPEWWISTLKLVTLADMAVNRLLRDPVSTEGHNAQIWETVIRDIYRRRAAMGKRPPASLTLMADTSVVCVMPKVRVAAVGATLRNMTRNLALLPGHREVRCRWDFSPDVAPSEDLDTLDILLIPAPFELQGNNFVANRDANATLSELRYYKKGWETFRIEQTWIKGEKRASFIEDCLKLMERARQETACVNGVILPEYALDYDLFHELCTALKGIEKNLEFVISGSSSNCRTDDGEYRANENDEVPNLGNHVVSRVWYDRGREEVYIDNSRIKHHRWRLDRPQVETYALSTALNPKIENWWEDTPLGRREIHFHRFREKSVFSVLICEELARSEPCHEILRSVAPNLIFALLLDGPQIKERWPAQYASNLADDPGSSVLTFTSWGLIARSNAQGRYKENRSIALWKDDGGNFLSIQMPTGNGARGVLLSLWSAHVKDMTMAGKQSVARAWRYSSHMPITLSQ